jgi:hypothetical protein
VRDFDSFGSEGAELARENVRRLGERREAITRLLPKDSRLKRPEMMRMLKEIGLEQRYYIPYRITSHVAHGGAGADEWVVRQDADGISFAGAVKPAAWKDPFRMASWSVVQPGIVVLARAGASPSFCEHLLSCHTKVLEITEQLGSEA